MKELLQPRLRCIVDLMRAGQLHMPSVSAVTPVIPRGGDQVCCPLLWGDVAAKGVPEWESNQLGNLLHEQSRQIDLTGDQSCQRNPLALLLQGDYYFNVAHAAYLFGYVDLVEHGGGLPPGFGPATAERDNWLTVLLQAISDGEESGGDTWLGLRGARHCPPLPRHWPATACDCLLQAGTSSCYTGLSMTTTRIGIFVCLIVPPTIPMAVGVHR